MVFLLDIAHSVAICALDTLGDRYQKHLISVECGCYLTILIAPFNRFFDTYEQ